MSHNHSSQIGGEEKFPVVAYGEFVVTGNDWDQARQQPGNQSTKLGQNKCKVSRPVCECRHTETIKKRHIGIIKCVLLALCLALTAVSITCNYLLWLKYEDLTNQVQKDIRPKLLECIDRLTDVRGNSAVEEDGDDVIDLEDGDVREGLLGRPDFVVNQEEDDTALIKEHQESILTTNHRFKRADRPRKTKRNNGKGGRQNRRGGNKKKPPFQVAALHLHGAPDTSFNGWSFVDWGIDPSVSESTYFDYSNGAVTVHKKGIYFIYSQITYATLQLQTSYTVYRNSTDERKMEILSCIAPMSNTIELHQTCYSARAYQLNAGDQLYVVDDCVEDPPCLNTSIVDIPNLSFWGLLALNINMTESDM